MNGRRRPQTREPLPWWPGFFVENPWIMGVLGLALAVAMVPLFFSALEDYRSFPDAPIETTSTKAFALALEGGEHWVTLTDVLWQCRNTLQEGKVVVLRAGRGRMFVVELGSSNRCEDLSSGPMTGVLDVSSDRRRRFLVEREGLRIEPADEPLLLLCTYCGGDNAKLGIFMAPAFMLLGLGMYPGLRMARKHYCGE